MDEDEADAVMERKRERKLTAKAWELKIESLQKDRKSKVNKIKNVIASMKELMQNDENSSKVYSLLETLKPLRDDVNLLHENVIPLLPAEEQIKQNEWYGSILRFNKGFIEDVEQWLCDLKFKRTSLTQTTTAVSEQRNESPLSSHSATDGIPSMTMAVQRKAPLNDPLPTAATYGPNANSKTLNQCEECDALTCEHFMDEINPNDSISNVYSKKSSKRSSASGSRSSRLFTSSARLQAEAEVAALLASQQMLQQKHSVEEEEERLRKKKEKIDLQTKIAVSMAKVNVYRSAASEQSIHEEVRKSRKENYEISPNSMAVASVQVDTHVEGLQSLPVNNSTRGARKKESNAQLHPVLQPRSITPLQSTVSMNGQLPYNCTSDAPVSRQSLTDREQGNILRLMEKQNEITSMLVQQRNISLLPHRDIVSFDGDPLQYRCFIRSFEEVVEKRANNYGDCFYFLEQYTRGQPRELVRSCQHMASTQGYLKAKALLKEHFGNEVKISSSYMDKVLSWKSIKPEDTKALQDYYLFLRACCNAMEDVRYMKELNLVTNMQIILSKLPFKLRDKWRAVVCDLQENRNGPATFKDIVDFVERQVKIATDPVFGNIVETPFGGGRSLTRSKPKGSSFATTVTVTGMEDIKKVKKGVSCLCCGEEHFLNSCTVLTKRPHKEKMDFLKKRGICFGCLCTGHISRDCKKRLTCKVCGSRHPSILHVFQRDISEEPKQAVGSALISVQSSSLTGAGEDACALSILPVYVKSKNGNKIVETYAFLDPGSSATFCTESLMNKLNLSGRKLNILLKTMNQDKLVSSYVLRDLEVAGLDETHYCSLPEVYTQKSMPVSNSNIPMQGDLVQWPYLNHIHFPSIKAGVELLIGSNVPEALEPWQVVRSQKNGPYAVRTILGWTVNGPLKGMEKNGTFCNDQPHVTVNRISVSKLDELWKQQYKTDFPENALDEMVGMSKEDNQFMDLVSQSIKLIDGHYCIGLPLKNKDVVLPNNRIVAEQRALNLQRRFRKDSTFLADYTVFMEDVISKGYAEKVPVEELDRHDGRVWYIPHHGVYHAKKKRIRVVFDCSASFQGLSLNAQLLQGPDLTSTLISVLTGFRMESVALMADVESMFYQVKVPAEDSDLLRFLWWSNGDLSKDLEEFRMVVHLFGASSSPSCSNYALRRCAEDHGDLFNCKTAEVIRNHFYVDDCLSSVPTESDAIQLYKELHAMCAKGGFHLTKWMSNSRAVLNALPEEDRVKEVKDLDLNHDVLPMERVLGVQWCAESDTFKFKVVIKDRPFTRRGILSVVGAIYDPLGFLSPVVLSAKKILQDLCRERIGWDSVIPIKYVQKWRNWLEDLHGLEKFEIKRCLKPVEFGEVTSAQLHHFSDASEEGYGVVTYLLLRNTQSIVHSAFLMGKARVAPVKSTTIPRMELTAATLASRMDRLWKRDLRMRLQDSVFWSDSTAVLKYIQNESSRFKCFVANRVSEILRASSAAQWRYIDSASNPADFASRGLNVVALLKEQMWTFGPPFLIRSQEEWPNNPIDLEKSLVQDPEIKQEAVVNALLVQTEEKDNAVARLINYYSSWTRLRKSVAWILRLKRILLVLSKKRKQLMETHDCTESDQSLKVIVDERMCRLRSSIGKGEGYLSSDELDDSEMAIVRFSQNTKFPEELMALQRGEEVKRSSPLYCLNPILEAGVIRMYGRLDNAAMPVESKHPIILSKDMHVSELLLRHVHHEVGHGGRNSMLSRLRQRYWIPGVSSAIRKVLSRSVICKRFQGTTGSQQMANLPSSRVSSDEPPFTRVGVDCFGPFEIKRGRITVKRYGVIFTCLSIRAIHVEVIASLDTDSFIHALRRFIARRGQVSELRSDNGTNFVGAERELREAIKNWNHDKISDVLIQKSIKWIFNPPTGSHHGGVWERMIRSVRKIMNSILRGQSIDEEGLHTLLCEVESIINGRPITRSSMDPNDLEALTPNHLLLLKTQPSLPPGLFQKEDIYVRRRWRQVQYMADLFWRRWLKENLPQLQERQKWLVKRRNFQVGDIVLIVNDAAPRNSWIMGKIIHTTPDKRGLIRQVKIKTKYNCLDRPVTKICLLLEAEEGCN